MTPAEIKAECERIWQTPGVAWPCHIAGWVKRDVRLRKAINTRFGAIFMSVRGKITRLLKGRFK